jgi:hypothetical protein
MVGAAASAWPGHPIGGEPTEECDGRAVAKLTRA